LIYNFKSSRGFEGGGDERWNTRRIKCSFELAEKFVDLTGPTRTESGHVSMRDSFSIFIDYSVSENSTELANKKRRRKKETLFLQVGAIYIQWNLGYTWDSKIGT